MLDTHAPWSLSKSDLAGKCPFAFKLRYLDRADRTTGTHAKIGVAAHRVQELILEGIAPKEALRIGLAENPDLTEKEIDVVETLLPNLAAFFERAQSFKQRHNVVQEFQEQKWAIDKKFNAIDYDDPSAFFRGIVDYALLTEEGYLVVFDHKSGRRHPVSKYAKQLDAYAVLGLSAFSGVKGVHAALHYMATKDIDWHFMRKTDEIRRTLQPHMMSYLTERAKGLEGYPLRPNKMCKWCDYLQHCETGTAKVAEEEEAARVERNRKARERNAEKKRLKLCE